MIESDSRIHPRRSTRSKARTLRVAAAALLLVFLAASEAWSAKQKPARVRKVTADEQLAFGVDMAKQGLWREALFRFQRAQLLEPNRPRVLNNLAVAFEAVGQFDLALEHYKKALEADPTNRDLRRNYARFVEFYQSFRPPEEAEGEATADSEGDGEPQAEADGV